jgi:hypothetical protein
MTNSVMWLIPLIVLSSPSATVLNILEHPQPVVGVGQSKPAAAQAQQAAVRSTNRFTSDGMLTARAEPGSNDDVDIAHAEPVDHRDRILHTVVTGRC